MNSMTCPEFTPEELTTEEWRIVPGFPDYEVSTLGRVKSNKTHKGQKPGKLLKATGKTYVHVGLWVDGKSTTLNVHQIVAAAFIGPCPRGKQINHKDKDEKNNRIDNLEYLTPSQNQQHAFNTGRAIGHAKLTEDDVRAIRERLRHQAKTTDLAKEYQVNITCIHKLRVGQTWKHVT
jgi:hypothetical protein